MNPNDRSRRIFLADDTATRKLGRILAECLAPATRLYFQGELGAGKTTLIRALLEHLGVKGHVKSPTFTLVEPYHVSRLYLYHFDFYRFSNPDEWVESGFRDHFASDAVCLVEWPERAALLIPEPDLWIRLEIAEKGRFATLEFPNSANTRIEQCVSALISRENFS